jgi:hypothetical protein
LKTFPAESRLSFEIRHVQAPLKASNIIKYIVLQQLLHPRLHTFLILTDSRDSNPEAYWIFKNLALGKSMTLSNKNPNFPFLLKLSILT